MQLLGSQNDMATIRLKQVAQKVAAAISVQTVNAAQGLLISGGSIPVMKRN